LRLASIEEILPVLAELAEARLASVSEEGYLIYARDLSEFFLADIRSACRKIARQEREEGETAWPTLAKLRKRVLVAKESRETRITMRMLRPEVRQALVRDRKLDQLPDGDRQKLIDAGELVPIGDVMEKLSDRKLLSADCNVARTIEPSMPVEEMNNCPHCGNQASPLGSASLFQLADYYRKRAENALEREQEESEETQ